MTDSSRNQSFIRHLANFYQSNDRQALAVFRRSLGRPPGQDLAPFRYFGRFLGDAAHPRDEWLLCLIAGLYALAPSALEGTGKSFGKTIREFCVEHPGAENGLGRRLTGLLNAHRDDLPQHLRHAVNLVGQGDGAIDWIRLMNDLQAWDRLDRKVQRQWAKDFWAYLPPASTKEQGSRSVSQEER